jgi:hypothetical protein
MLSRGLPCQKFHENGDFRKVGVQNCKSNLNSFFLQFVKFLRNKRGKQMIVKQDIWIPGVISYALLPRCRPNFALCFGPSHQQSMCLSFPPRTSSEDRSVGRVVVLSIRGRACRYVTSTSVDGPAGLLVTIIICKPLRPCWIPPRVPKSSCIWSLRIYFVTSNNTKWVDGSWKQAVLCLSGAGRGHCRWQWQVDDNVESDLTTQVFLSLSLYFSF